VLLVDFSGHNGRPHIISLPQCQSHLFQDELNLFSLGQGTVGFHMDILQHIGGSSNIPFFLLLIAIRKKEKVSYPSVRSFNKPKH
jgi:hypothetical protein